MGRKTPNKQSIKKHNVFQCAGTLIYTYTFNNKTGLSLKIFLKGKENQMINILTLKVKLSFRGQAKTVKRVDLSRYVDCNHGFPEKQYEPNIHYQLIGTKLFLTREFLFFRSPELKTQVSFSDHLSSVVCPSVRPSVCVSVRPSGCPSVCL